MDDRPPLSVVIPIRESIDEIEPVLDALLAQARRTGTEVLVVGPAGLKAAKGLVLAIGEDHAVPAPDWCEAVIRAHAEHPEAAAVAGCLVNATARTLSGRANFLAFAAPFQPPMPALPESRPPPVSALSMKREALEELDSVGGRFEAMLVPRLVAEGRVVADDRIVIDHYQDHGVLWSIVNGFHGARASYGYLYAGAGARERLRQARWPIANWPKRIYGDARVAVGGTAGNRRDLAGVALVGMAVGLGGAVGSIAGPGRSSERVA